MGSSLDELNSVSFTDIFDQDGRPAFVLDLDPDLESASTTNVIQPIFCNAALRSHDRLLDAILGDSGDETPDSSAHEDFRTWAQGVTKFDDSMDVFPLSFLYNGLLWTGSTIQKRWRVISGNNCYQTSDITPSDLGMGPPIEVATGGSVVELLSEKYTARPGHPQKVTVPAETSLSTLISNSSSATHTDYSKDTPKSTLVSSMQEQNLPKPGPKALTHEDSTDTWKSASTTSIRLTTPEKGVRDWTVKEPKGTLSAHLSFARSVDWASTSLGAMGTWSPEFRQVANLVMQNPQPAALFWGEEMTMMYNEAYRDHVAGRKHPALMGTGAEGPFAETWDLLSPVFAECARTGKSVNKENQMLPLERHGYLEETFFSWSFSPLYSGTSKILGFYNAPFETTRQVISSRRMQTLRTIDEKTSLSRTVKDFWRGVLHGLEENRFDVPFALLYSVIDADDGESSTLSSSSAMSMKSCVLEGSIAVPEGHPAAMPQLDLKRSREGFIPSFREAMRTREPTKLQTRDGTLPEILLDGIEWRGFGEPCREAVIFPLRPTNGESVLSFLLLGVNPRRAYDNEYKSFANMLHRQLATSLASTMLFEEEIRRSKNAVEAAALEQEQLTQQLAIQTSRLRRMTTGSLLGMYYIDPDGLILEANDRYYEMTGLSRDNAKKISWMDTIVEHSRPAVERGWQKLVVDLVPWTGELQLKKMWTDPLNVNAEPIDYWILAISQPELAPDGTLQSVMGSITDISHLKWAQGLQNRRLREAEETRRQQNEFIDITSHEMRNPLSAILQCADDISASLSEYQASDTHKAATIVENCIDAANTIALCAQHQKSIVDDILTISKLDSDLLVITPVPVQPVAVAQRAVKMFDAELQAKDIKSELCVHASTQELGVDFVDLDPSRLLQVLINLMTNAIKFTQAEDKRSITVRIAASSTPPSEESLGVEYVPLRNPQAKLVFGEDWGSGDLVFLHFSVRDTGCGLTVGEKQLLFKRFSQASPRTHAQYGGSGLGLFISRQLTELHGGQIGVASEAHVGSTFGFYIKARRSRPLSSTPTKLALPFKNTWQRDRTPSQAVKAQNKKLPLIAPQASLAASETVPPTHSKELSVLIVEDNLVNQKVLTKQLRKIGCIVSVANHGEEALEYLEGTVFRREGGQKLSIVLMDLEMPIMDGLTCVKKIRKMEAEGTISRHVPVIAVTANARYEQIAAAKGSGMDDVVSKPFRIPELMAKIEILLSSLEDPFGGTPP